MESLSSEFTHHQAAHCESGVTSNLLKNSGIPISEAMSFGIGGGLFFIHVPFVKVMGLPLTSFRSFPGGIFKKTCKRLGIPYEYRTFSNVKKGEQAMDSYLAQGQAVGLRSNIYWLPYIPQQFRFQFNGHNLVVYGKNPDDTYDVSDPVLETVSVCSVHAMNKARFAKGVLAPKGLIFFPKTQGASVNVHMAQAVRSGIAEVTNRMLFTPPPLMGIAGIRYLSRKMSQWPRKFSLEELKLQVANVVRMQEEIGTGGAGFRYLYAAFLQESGIMLNEPVLLEASKSMTAVGDVWREFATLSAKFCKDRLDVPYEEIPKLLLRIAEQEKAIFKDLRRRYL